MGRSGRDQRGEAGRQKICFLDFVGLSRKKGCIEQKLACTALQGGGLSKGRRQQRDVMTLAEGNWLPAY